MFFARGLAEPLRVRLLRFSQIFRHGRAFYRASTVVATRRLIHFYKHGRCRSDRESDKLPPLEGRLWKVPHVRRYRVTHMREERGLINGDVVVYEPFTLWGTISGTVKVIDGGKF